MILAIDPGTTESAFCFIDEQMKPVRFGKCQNIQLIGILQEEEYVRLVIEMIASYGMPVGKEVFETCVWIGRFVQVADDFCVHAEFVYRNEVKSNLCHSSKANDATIKQALVDRFAYNVSNHGKGKKDSPGWFYGFHRDIWSAYAVAITYADTKEKGK